MTPATLTRWRPPPRPGDVLVLDYDKTLADDHGVVPQAAKDALRRWREAGGIVVDNTGRRAGDFLGENGPSILPDLADYVDYVVAETGSVVIDVAQDRMLMLGERPPQELVDALTAGFSPAFTSPYRVQCVKTLDPDGPTGDPNVVRVKELVEQANAQFGISLHVAQNIDSLMVMPEGIDKRVGLAKVLELMRERGQGGGRIVGGGDAPNDLPFLDACDVSFGVERGARLNGRVDCVTQGLMGEGVAELADATRRLHGQTAPVVDEALATTEAMGMNPRERATRRQHAPFLRAQADVALHRIEKRAGVEVREHLGLPGMAAAERARQATGPQGLAS